jgi:hypothetical protein
MDESKIGLTERLRAEGRWGEASRFKDETLRTLRSQGMTKAEAGEAAWEALSEKYPPQAQAEAAAVNVRVQGLGDIPASWPELADNASLQAELAWVQSNRLRVVEEKPSGATRVHLDRARSPAPSWAALGWLETSIRSYAKYIDVVAKNLAVQQDEQELVRREKMAIEEIRGLLAEMLQDSPDS